MYSSSSFWLSATHKTTNRSSLFAAVAVAAIAESIYRCLCVVNYWRLIIIRSFFLTVCLSHFCLVLFQYIYANSAYKSHTGQSDFEFLTCANNLLTKIDYLQNRCDSPLDFVNLTVPHTPNNPPSQKIDGKGWIMSGVTRSFDCFMEMRNKIDIFGIGTAMNELWKICFFHKTLGFNQMDIMLDSLLHD